MTLSATIVIASYDDEKITKTINAFKKFAISHKLKEPISIRQPKNLIKIPGCNGRDLKRKSIRIGGLETLSNVHTVRAPKGVLLQFI